MPKYDLSTPILNDKGEQHVENGEAITVGKLARRALLSDYQRGGGIVPGEEKLKRWTLWQRLANHDDAEGPVDLKPEEAMTIKNCAEAFSTFAYGQIVQLLDS